MTRGEGIRREALSILYIRIDTIVFVKRGHRNNFCKEETEDNRSINTHTTRSLDYNQKKKKKKQKKSTNHYDDEDGFSKYSEDDRFSPPPYTTFM